MSTAAQLLVGGERTSGESIRSQNGEDNNNRVHPKNYFHSHLIFVVMAALSVANIVKTSLGPVGLDKMLVDDVGVRKFCCISI